MDAADKRMLEREALRNMIQQWNANRLDLFELSEPNEVCSEARTHKLSTSIFFIPLGNLRISTRLAILYSSKWFECVHSAPRAKGTLITQTAAATRRLPRDIYLSTCILKDISVIFLK